MRETLDTAPTRRYAECRRMEGFHVLNRTFPGLCSPLEFESADMSRFELPREHRGGKGILPKLCAKHSSLQVGSGAEHDPEKIFVSGACRLCDQHGRGVYPAGFRGVPAPKLPICGAGELGFPLNPGAEVDSIFVARGTFSHPDAPMGRTPYEASEGIRWSFGIPYNHVKSRTWACSDFDSLSLTVKPSGHFAESTVPSSTVIEATPSTRASGTEALPAT